MARSLVITGKGGVQILPVKILDDPQIPVAVLPRWFHHWNLRQLIVPGNDLAQSAMPVAARPRLNV